MVQKWKCGRLALADRQERQEIGVEEHKNNSQVIATLADEETEYQRRNEWKNRDKTHRQEHRTCRQTRGCTWYDEL